jgi:hypothetical protein
MASKSEIVFCLVAVLVFYGHIIPHYGAEISGLCIRDNLCRHYLVNHTTISEIKVDLSDNQWREFRSSLPLAISAAIGMTLLHEIFRLFKKPTIVFHLVSGLCFLIVQHGRHSIVVLVIILVSYVIGKYFKRSKFGSLWMWVCGLSVILLKESYRVQHQEGFEVNLDHYQS